MIDDSSNNEKLSAERSATDTGESLELTTSPSDPTVWDESQSKRLNAGPALKEIWGKWPGDESIDELLADLTP